MHLSYFLKILLAPPLPPKISTWPWKLPWPECLNNKLGLIDGRANGHPIFAIPGHVRVVMPRSHNSPCAQGRRSPLYSIILNSFSAGEAAESLAVFVIQFPTIKGNRDAQLS